jgi:ABC-type transport system involved in multi-copper enzyme maturation permease subunit
MTRILHIAKREWLELRRQPAMLGVIGLLYLAICLLIITALGLLDTIAADPKQAAFMAEWFSMFGDGSADVLSDLAGGTIALSNFLLFTQFLGITAVMAGHTVLHDRQCSTLPFLLLAPVRRYELIAGKVLGVVLPPFLGYVVLAGGTSLLAAGLSISVPHQVMLPPSSTWLISFFLGAPVWATFIATVCAIISSVAKDVRTAQQSVWFVMFFATFFCGYLLTMLLEDGVGTQLGVVGLGLLCIGGAIAVGSQVISRDLGR